MGRRHGYTICGKDYMRRDRVDRYIAYMLKNPHYFRQLARAEPTIRNIRRMWKAITSNKERNDK